MYQNKSVLTKNIHASSHKRTNKQNHSVAKTGRPVLCLYPSLCLSLFLSSASALEALTSNLLCWTSHCRCRRVLTRFFREWLQTHGMFWAWWVDVILLLLHCCTPSVFLNILSFLLSLYFLSFSLFLFHSSIVCLPLPPFLSLLFCFSLCPLSLSVCLHRFLQVIPGCPPVFLSHRLFSQLDFGWLPTVH